MPKVAQATFTEFDEAQSQAYVEHRMLLFQLWDLATTYPCIASKIEIRIRQADPREDYLYEESMADAAIVVSLRWMNTENACSFLRCHNTYPHSGYGTTCRPTDEPRVFPTGDSSIMTACEPGCFFMRNLKTVNDTGVPLTVSEIRRRRYASDSFHVMSLRDGLYRRRIADEMEPDSSARSRRAAGSSSTKKDPSPKLKKSDARNNPDLALFEYSRESDTCELGNEALVRFIAQPWARVDEGEKAVCRVTNFAIGEDVLYGARIASISIPSHDPTVDRRDYVDKTTTTGRYTASYCAAFEHDFDPKTRTCEVPLWEEILRYTFLGQTLVRLARHALHGGDRCDEVFPALPISRSDTDPAQVRDLRLLSRSAWYDDVDRTWCCPPPNIMLSDLGIYARDRVWTNRLGGTVEKATPLDFRQDVTAGRTSPNDLVSRSTERESSAPFVRVSRRADAPSPSSSTSSSIASSSTILSSTSTTERSSSFSIADADARDLARRALQQHHQRKSFVGKGAPHNDRPFVGAVIGATTGSNNEIETGRKKRSTDGRGVLANERRPLLDFDKMYSNAVLRTKNELSSDRVRQLLTNLSKDVGIMVGNIYMQQMIVRLMKAAYNRTLRFVGQRFAGKISRTLLGLGLRVATARMISSVLTGLTTRMMLTMSTASTGIGAIIGVVEMLAFLLDMAVVFGWDPGNYKAMASNEVFDGMAMTWMRVRTRQRMPLVDPYYILHIYSKTYSRTETPVVGYGGDGEDESRDAVARSDVRFVIMANEDVPWFFEKFTVAMRVMIDDANGVNDGAADLGLLGSVKRTFASRVLFRDVADSGSVERKSAMSRDAEITRHTRRREKMRAAKLHFDATASERNGPSTANRTRPVFADSPAICSVLWTMHYFAHRAYNSNGQRVDYLNDKDDSFDLTDEMLASAVRDNEVAAFLQTSLYSPVPRARLIGAARRNIATKGLRLMDRCVLLVGGALTAIFAGSLVVGVTPRTSVAAIMLLMFALLFVAIPLTLCSTVMEFIAPDGGYGDARSRTYERKNEETDRDELDEFCDTALSALYSSLEREDNDGAIANAVLHKFLSLNDMLPELRVLRKSYAV